MGGYRVNDLCMHYNTEHDFLKLRIDCLHWRTDKVQIDEKVFSLHNIRCIHVSNSISQKIGSLCPYPWVLIWWLKNELKPFQPKGQLEGENGMVGKLQATMEPFFIDSRYSNERVETYPFLYFHFAVKCKNVLVAIKWKVWNLISLGLANFHVRDVCCYFY